MKLIESALQLLAAPQNRALVSILSLYIPHYNRGFHALSFWLFAFPVIYKQIRHEIPAVEPVNSGHVLMQLPSVFVATASLQWPKILVHW